MQESAHTPHFSRYTIKSTLGSGGMGTVYLANHEILNRPVALKVPKRELASSDHFVQRFLREAKALGTLHHRNIVTVYDAGIENNTPYIAMKYIAGETLSDLVRTNGQIDIDNVIRWGRQMADALAYLHDQQILHRDLKGANVIIDQSGDAIIADFGIAQIEADSSLTRGVLGTPAYMSPEQAMGKDLDARSDMHGLGVILYQCLTGTLPFQDDNSLALIQKVIHETPKAVSELRPETPVWLEDIVKKCLQKHPSHRYKDDHALIKAFDNGMTRPTRHLSMSFLPARRKIEVVKQETLKPQPSVRVLDLIRSKANTLHANFDGERTITIFDLDDKRPSRLKKLLQHSVFLSFAAILALILVAPLTFSQLSGRTPDQPGEQINDTLPTASASNSSDEEVEEEAPERTTNPQKKQRDLSLASLFGNKKSVEEDSIPAESMPSSDSSYTALLSPKNVQPLSILPIDTNSKETTDLVISPQNTDSTATTQVEGQPASSQLAASGTGEIPVVLEHLVDSSTRRELIRTLESLRKANQVRYGNRRRVSQPDLAYIFLLKKSEDGMHAVLIPSQSGWTDIYTGQTMIHEKGDFILINGGIETKLEQVDPIWVEVLPTESEAPPAKLKRKVTGW